MTATVPRKTYLKIIFADIGHFENSVVLYYLPLMIWYWYNCKLETPGIPYSKSCILNMVIFEWDFLKWKCDCVSILRYLRDIGITGTIGGSAGNIRSDVYVK